VRRPWQILRWLAAILWAAAYRRLTWIKARRSSSRHTHRGRRSSSVSSAAPEPGPATLWHAPVVNESRGGPAKPALSSCDDRRSIGMPGSRPIRYSRGGRANSCDAVNSPARLSPTPTADGLKAGPLTGHAGCTPANDPASVAHGGSCHAHSINPCPAHAAGKSGLRDHAFRLRNRRRCHSLRRCCNQQGEASNSNQPDHSAPPLSAQSLGPVTERGWYGSHVSSSPPYRLQAKVARTLEIDQGP
jgi:hypothetical protein